MGQDTEQLTTTPADIEATRAELSRDLDELTDKVNPQRVVERRTQAARGRLGSVRDRVMGGADRARSATPGVGDVAGSVSGSVSGTAHSAVDRVGSTTEGNPLTAGAVAFGLGLLVAGLLPPSEKEKQAAQRVVEAAQEHGQPLVDQARSVGQEIGQQLGDSAAQSAQQVKDSAQESVQHVKQEGQSSAATVKDDAQQKTQEVRGS
ncbi:DUF3618 domain-containing protein [Nocardioides aurantiacus]|uniref:DUF3618 domain-containing protein n=1 Tax=Nocardioides aurantiacus TaxID=86796 RepID=UPI00403F1056